VGVNWYPNRLVRLMFNFEHTAFDGGAAQGVRDAENIFLTRFQLAF
jgi:phosphate-selective porin